MSLEGHAARPGPTVDDLVEALTTQATRQASTPNPATLAGYSGTYLVWSVPVDAIVTGDAEFEGCDLGACTTTS